MAKFLVTQVVLKARQHYLDALSIAEANDFRMIREKSYLVLERLKAPLIEDGLLVKVARCFQRISAVDRMRGTKFVHRVVMGH